MRAALGAGRAARAPAADGEPAARRVRRRVGLVVAAAGVGALVAAQSAALPRAEAIAVRRRVSRLRWPHHLRRSAGRPDPGPARVRRNLVGARIGARPHRRSHAIRHASSSPRSRSRWCCSLARDFCSEASAAVCRRRRVRHQRPDHDADADLGTPLRNPKVTPRFSPRPRAVRASPVWSRPPSRASCR